MNNDKSSPGATLFIVSAVQFLTPYMMSAVGVALPTIGKEFSASAVQLGLVETIYILAASLFLVPAGRMADIKGRKKVFTSGAVVFTMGTIAISFSTSIESFIVFRFFQGAGAAMVTSTSVAILTSVFPASQRGKAMGVIVGCVYAGLSAGPGLAGVLVTHFGWRWVFYLVVPFQFIALYLTIFKLKGEWLESENEKFDLIGSLIYIFSLFLLISGASRLNTNIYAAPAMVTGFIGFILFFIYESKIEFPVLNVALLKENRVFAMSNLATMINYAASFGVTFLLSLYLQTTKALSPKEAGIILLTQPVIQTVLSPVTGKMSDKFSSSKLATIGMAICAVALFAGGLIDSNTPISLIYVVLILMGLGFSIFSSPNMNAVMGSVEPKHYGIASSLVATMRTLGMLVSMTTITLIFSVYMGDLEVTQQTSDLFVKSMKTGFFIFSGLSIAGVLSSFGRISK